MDTVIKTQLQSASTIFLERVIKSQPLFNYIPKNIFSGGRQKLDAAVEFFFFIAMSFRPTFASDHNHGQYDCGWSGFSFPLLRPPQALLFMSFQQPKHCFSTISRTLKVALVLSHTPPHTHTQNTHKHTHFPMRAFGFAL